MQYGKIISTGFGQAWKHKTLWIFGLFISGGMSFNVFDITKRSDTGNWRRVQCSPGERFSRQQSFHYCVSGGGHHPGHHLVHRAHTISTGGLIDAGGQLKRNETYSFGKAVRAGLTFFWRVLGLGILTFVVVLAFILFLVLVGVVAFVIHTAIGVFVAFDSHPDIYSRHIHCGYYVRHGQSTIVIRNDRVFDAITDGFNLWKSHLGPSVAYTFIYIAIGIAVFLGILLIAISAVLPFVGVAFVNLIVALIVGIPVVLAILLVVEGFSGSAMHLMTTEFYFQLVDEAALRRRRSSKCRRYTACAPGVRSFPGYRLIRSGASMRSAHAHIIAFARFCFSRRPFP